MKINPLNKNIFSNKIDDTFNIFYIFGNNLGLIDICYSKLRKNLEVDLDDPFITNYFDENKLLNNTEAFFDELNSIPVFGSKKTIIVDIRQGDKKNDVTKIFTEFNFSEIKEIQLIIISYLFKQSDILSKKLINSKNAICFTCYEENEENIKNNLKKQLVNINLNLNEPQIHELTNKFSNFLSINIILQFLVIYFFLILLQILLIFSKLKSIRQLLASFLLNIEVMFQLFQTLLLFVASHQE